jgi:hypothetical protein
MKAWYKDFIGVYENAFSPEYCNYLIEQGNKDINKANLRPKGSEIFYQDLSFSLNDSITPEANEHFQKQISTNILPLYFTKYGVAFKNVIESGYELCDMKFQKTQPSEGFHLWHSEVSPVKEYIIRWGVYTLYLNDIEEGGETEFLYQNLRLPPKQGTFSIFPSYYTHTHRGNPPLSGTKYIITGWLTYPHKILDSNE